jgi:hypothetical protein
MYDFVSFNFDAVVLDEVRFGIMLGISDRYEFNTIMAEIIDKMGKIHRHCYYFDYDDYYKRAGVDVEEAILRFIKEKKVSVLIFIDGPPCPQLSLDFLSRIRSHVFTVLALGDIFAYFETYFRQYAQTFDLLLVDEYAEKFRMKLFDFDAVYVPYSFDAGTYSPPEVSKDIDVSFIGRQDRVGRQELIEYLMKNGINLQLYGVGTENGPVTQRQMIEIFARSKINLNFTGVQLYQRYKYAQPIDLRYKSVKGRCQEIAMAGGFVLTESGPGMELLFEDKKEFSIFRNKEELLEQVEYYLANEQEREEIASCGQQKAHSEYESTVVWTKVFKIITHKIYTKSHGYHPIYHDRLLGEEMALRRGMLIGDFLRERRFARAFLELRYLFGQKCPVGLIPLKVFWAMFREVFRPIVNSSSGLKRVVAKIRSFRAAPIWRR